MPYTTLVAGNPIQASWANANVRDQVVTPFATAAARNAAITSPVEGMIASLADSDTLTRYNGSQWVTITKVAAIVATSQGSSSGTYVDLATVGPQITLETGATALITVGGYLTCTAGGTFLFMAFAISGATTRAPSDANALVVTVPTNNGAMDCSKEILVTGLTPGSNTFLAKYRGGTGASYAARMISGVGL